MEKLSILLIITFACGFFGNNNVISNANPLPYEAIFNFGDSISDTGNAATLFPPMPSNSPYGSTFFKRASGRMSDGRLIIDFIAEAYGLPHLPAYLALTKGQDVKQGVNFAVAGTTALDIIHFMRKDADIPVTNQSLSVQLAWFKGLKSSLCTTKQECDNYLKKSLFLVGEIGGNDLNALIPHKNITAIQEIIPQIIEEITKTTTALIEEGAVELVLPGNFPIGCNAAVLFAARNDNKDDYDKFGCLTTYNTLVENYNEQLKKAIETLRQKNPQARIIYFDYYNDAKRLYEAPEQYGFVSGNEAVKACCWPICGSPTSTVCSDPSKHINWDGPHFTEAAYKLIAKGLVEGQFANPPLKPAPVKIA